MNELYRRHTIAAAMVCIASSSAVAGGPPVASKRRENFIPVDRGFREKPMSDSLARMLGKKRRRA